MSRLMLPVWGSRSAATFLRWIPFTYPGKRAAVVGLFVQLQHGLRFKKSQPGPDNNATRKALTCTTQATIQAQNSAKDEKENIVGFCQLSFTRKCWSSLYSLGFLEVMTLACRLCAAFTKPQSSPGSSYVSAEALYIRHDEAKTRTLAVLLLSAPCSLKD